MHGISCGRYRLSPTPNSFCGGSSLNHGSNILWDDRFSADRGHSPPICFHAANKDILHFWGFSCEEVAAVSTVCVPRRGRTKVDWNELMARWSNFASRESDLPESELERESYLAVTAGLAVSKTSLSQGANYATVRNLACRGRRLFITRGGALGLGPAHTAEGNQVCILLGSPVPVVLLECNTCRLKQQGRVLSRTAETEGISSLGVGGKSTAEEDYLRTWRFVGDANVHDLNHLMNYQGDIRADVRCGRL